MRMLFTSHFTFITTFFWQVLSYLPPRAVPLNHSVCPLSAYRCTSACNKLPKNISRANNER